MGWHLFRTAKGGKDWTMAESKMDAEIPDSIAWQFRRAPPVQGHASNAVAAEGAARIELWARHVQAVLAEAPGDIDAALVSKREALVALSVGTQEADQARGELLWLQKANAYKDKIRRINMLIDSLEEPKEEWLLAERVKVYATCGETRIDGELDELATVDGACDAIELSANLYSEALTKKLLSPAGRAEIREAVKEFRAGKNQLAIHRVQRLVLQKQASKTAKDARENFDRWKRERRRRIGTGDVG